MGGGRRGRGNRRTRVDERRNKREAEAQVTEGEARGVRKGAMGRSERRRELKR